MIKLCQRLTRLHRPLCRRVMSTEVTITPEHERVVFSGIQPTGVPHLGNYLGALKQWVELQKEPGEIYYSIVDLHSLTVPHEQKIKDKVLDMTAFLLAVGIDPKRCVLFKQSDVFEHTMLAWLFNCMVSMNSLKNMTQWKEKSKETRRSANLGLYAYPVLQCADIMLYRATHVPAGDDQTQHIELCRNFAKSFNHLHGDFFPQPRQISDPHSTRVRSLRDPFFKMSKSDRSEHSRICLNDSDDDIWNKIKKAVTDGYSEVTYDPTRRPGVSNLVQIHSCVTGLPVAEICDRVQGENLDTGQYKMVVAEAVVECVKPIRTEYEKLVKDVDYLENVLAEGGAVAKEVAQKNWKEIEKLIGLR